MPDELEGPINEAIAKLDTDRSKLIRVAVREKLARHGIKTRKEAV